MQHNAADFKTVPFAQMQAIHGIAFPARMKFQQLLVTGPPGSGKSTMIRAIKGWPEEGYVDLAMEKWWKARALAMRPREIHLGIPYHGHAQSLAVFDDEWKHASNPLDLEFSRIKIPPAKKYFFSTNWRDRYVFEILIPSFQTLYDRRKRRKKRGTHPVDEHLDAQVVNRQISAFRDIAFYLFKQGLNVHIREAIDCPPKQIKLSEDQ